MVLFNYSTKEITAKVVYYGPGLCGKTTNLQYIYDNLPQNIQRGRMLSLATKTDRTLFFDFLPIDLGNIRGMKTRVQLYTVPGQVFYNSTRKLVLKGADGIVFVADSQEKMMEANLESFRNLEENCIENGIDIGETPLVIQFNKRDLPGIASVEDLNNNLNKYNAPFYESVATTGIGVHETLKGVTKLVLHSLREKYAGEAAAKPPARPVTPATPEPRTTTPPSADQAPPAEEEPAPTPAAPPGPPPPVEEEPIQLVEEETGTPAVEEEPVLVEEESVLVGEEPEEEAPPTAAGTLEDVFAAMETDDEEPVVAEEAPPQVSPAPPEEPPMVEGLLTLAEEPEPAAPAESFADLAAELGSEPASPLSTPEPQSDGIDLEEEDPLGLGPAGEEDAPGAVTPLPPLVVEPGTDHLELPFEVRSGDEVQRFRLTLRISLTRDT